MSVDGLAGGRATVLGAGRQGLAAAYDFAVHAGAATVRLADADGAALERGAARLRALAPRCTVETRVVDAADEAALAAALEGSRTALSALPYRFGPRAAAAAVRARCPLVDLGGNSALSAEILALDGAAREAGIALVPDTGLAPGLANSLAAAGLEGLAAGDEVRIWCGGLPQTPTAPLGYRLVFSPQGLINEYSGHAAYLRDGHPCDVPSLSEVMELDLPGVGTVEAFPTSGGTSTAPSTFAGKLRTFEYRTVRYPGHRDRFLAFAELGLFDEREVELPSGARVVPRELLIERLVPLIDLPHVPDLIVLRVEVRGRDERGMPRRVVYDLLDRQDAKTGFTAMERCTAYPAAAVAEMAACGELAAGALRLERDVPSGPYLERLARRPLRLERHG